MVAVKSLWVLLKSFSTNFSFKRDSSVRVPDHKPDKRIRYNRLRPQWHRPYYPSADPEIGRGGGSSAGGGGGGVSSSKSYQDCLNGNCGEDGEVVAGGIDPSYYNNKDFDNFINSDSDYEDGDSDAEDFEDDFTTTDEDDDSDLDDEEDDVEEVLTCEVCERVFPTMKKLADHQEKKRHYGCSQCDSIFPNRKALDFHREQMDHFDFVSDYGTDDTTSFGSGSVGDGGISASSSNSSGVGSSVDEDKCSSISGTQAATSSLAGAVGGPGNHNINRLTYNSTGRSCVPRKPNNNNNYHCYGNQLHACWYEGEDEEEKGLLRN